MRRGRLGQARRGKTRICRQTTFTNGTDKGMAGDWLPIRLDLHDDPAVIAIAAACDIPESHVVGSLVKLWSWANRHLTDGNARGVTEAFVDRYLSVPKFANSMIEAGWLTRENGHVAFPKFDKWNSNGGKKRLLAGKRQADFKKRLGNAESVTKASTKEEKRIEEKKKENPPTPHGGDERKANPIRAKRERKPKPPRKPREPDPLFDAVAEVTGSDPTVAGGHVAKLRHLLAAAIPPYTPKDVWEFAARFGEFCPWGPEKGRLRPTLGELEKNIGGIRASPPPATASIVAPKPAQMTFAERDTARFNALGDAMASTGAATLALETSGDPFAT